MIETQKVHENFIAALIKATKDGAMHWHETLSSGMSGVWFPSSIFFCTRPTRVEVTKYSDSVTIKVFYRHEDRCVYILDPDNADLLIETITQSLQKRDLLTLAELTRALRDLKLR